MSSWHQRLAPAVLGLSVALVGAATPAAADDPPATPPPTEASTPQFVSGPVAVLAAHSAVIGRNTTITGGAVVVRDADTGTYPTETPARTRP
jgi:UDP-3-O-[3-hydroxymyristoyl] glucosamine N-acyltransferase